MNTEKSNRTELIDTLAAIEHERWAHWQRYLHSKAELQHDGSLLLPRDLVERWKRQIETNFEDLPDDEKDSDRQQVLRYLPLVEDWIASRR